jgi:sugar phosphate isomerase/epimerase
VHPRLTVHDHVFARGESLAAVLAGFSRAGVERVGLARRRLAGTGWASAGDALRAAGLELTHVAHGPLVALDDKSAWPDAVARATDTLAGAAAMGVRCVYGVTGPAMSLPWEEAAEAFITAVAPVAAKARAYGVPLLIEPANMLFAHKCFVHTLRDAVDLAAAAGLGVCIDVQHCWDERGLRETIRRGSGVVGLVQLSDYIPGRTVPHRAIPGDGVIPLERIVAAILEDGYTGLFDLELYGEPGIDPAATVARAADRAGAMLARLGA